LVRLSATTVGCLCLVVCGALGCDTPSAHLVGTGTSGGVTGSASSGTSSSDGSGTSGTGGACPSEVPVDHRPVSVDCDGGLADGGSYCWKDADCDDAGFGPSGLCSCAPQTRGFGAYTANVCIPNDCLHDADCACGYCSPTVDSMCGGFYGWTGFYCHTPQDTCVNDSDCDGGYCAFMSEVGHWGCGYGHCAG
jgi:hypothetical protein